MNIIKIARKEFSNSSVDKRTVLIAIILVISILFFVPKDFNTKLYKVGTNDDTLLQILSNSKAIPVDLTTDFSFNSSDIRSDEPLQLDLHSDTILIESKINNPDYSYIDAYIINNGTSLNLIYGRSTRSKAAAKAVIDILVAYNEALYAHDFIYNKTAFNELYPVWIEIEDYDFRYNLSDQRPPPKEERMLSLSRNFNQPAAGIADFTLTSDEPTTPAKMSIAIPFKSLIFSLIILTPLIFISTSYVGSVINEKINKKGSLLLTAPLRLYEIIIGKTLPYITTCCVISLSVMAYLEPNQVLKIIPALMVIILAYFSLSFSLAIAARSYKEMSFFKTSFGSLLIAYLLIPTLFISITQFAYMSPLTTITQIMTGANVSLQQYIFSILPLTVFSIILYYVFSNLFNDEQFANQSLINKIINAVRIHKPYQLFLYSIAVYPIAVLAESVFLLLVVFPSKTIPILLLIIVAAVVEEILKNTGVRILMNNRKMHPIAAGLLAGLGFALAEKIILLFSIKELVQYYSYFIIPTFIIPFIIHSLTCISYAYTKRYWIPVLLHIAYNITVFMLLTQ
ncbi:PrsW family intramembrane metalloprotease [Candidatus Woesearchaeota archaeon]|nr:PrsW family intramembrane metalloprotease [Candidatus Woesearchaeota archaeon]